MKTLLIINYSNVGKQGILLHFNEKVSLDDGVASNEIWVSWDKIGRALCGEKYCETNTVAELNQIRNRSNFK